MKLQTSPTNKTITYTVTGSKTVRVSWASKNAHSVAVDNLNGPFELTGYRDITVDNTTTFTTSAFNEDGKSDVRTININIYYPPLPTAILNTSPNTITSGDSSTLSWNTTNADTVTINNGIGTVDATGTRVVSPLSTTVYTLTAANVSGSTIQSNTLTVNSPPTLPLPAAILNTSPNPITSGDSSTLSWNTKNADIVTIDNGIGIVGTDDSRVVSPSYTTVYNLTAANSSGSTVRSITLNVDTPPSLADYLILSYSWTLADGKDMDQSTSIVSPVSTVTLGWNQAASVPPYIYWGGDDVGTAGTEYCYVDLRQFTAAAIIKVRCAAWWYSTRIAGNVVITAAAYKGGAIVKTGLAFTNPTGTIITSTTLNTTIPLSGLTGGAGKANPTVLGFLNYNKGDFSLSFSAV